MLVAPTNAGPSKPPSDRNGNPRTASPQQNCRQTCSMAGMHQCSPRRRRIQPTIPAADSTFRTPKRQNASRYPPRPRRFHEHDQRRLLLSHKSSSVAQCSLILCHRQRFDLKQRRWRSAQCVQANGPKDKTQPKNCLSGKVKRKPAQRTNRMTTMMPSFNQSGHAKSSLPE